MTPTQTLHYFIGEEGPGKINPKFEKIHKLPLNDNKSKSSSKKVKNHKNVQKKPQKDKLLENFSYAEGIYAETFAIITIHSILIYFTFQKQNIFKKKTIIEILLKIVKKNWEFTQI